MAALTRLMLATMKYHCVHGHEFFSVNLSPYLYGEFLLRSANKEIRYLNAINDGVFDEVGDLVQESLAETGVQVADWSDILHAIFGEIACDSALDGTSFKMNVAPPCPVCGTNTMNSWDSAEADPIEMDVCRVTHNHWQRLSTDAKYHRGHIAVKEFNEYSSR